MAAGSTSWRGRWALLALVIGYVLLELAAAAPDTPLAPPRPSGVGLPSGLASASRALGLHRMGRLGLTVFAVLVLGGLVGAFVVLLIEAWSGRVSLAAVAVAGVASLALAVAGPVLLSRDVYSYAAYGRMVSVHGANPYASYPADFPTDPFTGVISPAWRHTRSVYGPAFTWLSAGLAAESPAAEVLAFKLAAGIAVAGAAWLAGTATVRWGRPSVRAAAVALVALNPVMVVHTVGGAHNDALVALALAGAVHLAGGWRPAPATDLKTWRETPSALGHRGRLIALVLSAGALVKIVAVIPLLLFAYMTVARSGSRRQASRTAVDHVALVGGLAALLLWPFGARGLTAMANLATRQGWASGARLVARGLHGAGDVLGGPALGDGLGSLVYASFLALFGLVLWRLARRATPATAASDWATALVVFALAAPYLLPWYMAWFLPLLVLAGEGRTLRVGIAMACLLALTGVPAEPGSAPVLWRDMLLAVHYVAAPITLGLLLWALPHVFRQPVSPTPAGSARPAP